MYKDLSQEEAERMEESLEEIFGEEEITEDVLMEQLPEIEHDQESFILALQYAKHMKTIGKWEQFRITKDMIIPVIDVIDMELLEYLFEFDKNNVEVWKDEDVWKALVESDDTDMLSFMFDTQLFPETIDGIPAQDYISNHS